MKKCKRCKKPFDVPLNDWGVKRIYCDKCSLKSINKREAFYKKK